jgi:hypothetical protein
MPTFADYVGAHTMLRRTARHAEAEVLIARGPPCIPETII